MHIDSTLPISLITINDQSLWNKRLGNTISQVLKMMGLPLENSICSTCEINKAHQQLLNHNSDVPVKPLELMIKFLKKKSNSFSEFSILKIFMENQKDLKIKSIVPDRGGEFLNKHFKDLTEECGITKILSPAETPQQKGYAERANKTILEKTKCLLRSANLPYKYWAEATPQNIWVSCIYCQSHKPPDLEGVEGILLRYESKNTAYRILRITDAKVIITKHAAFDKNKFPSLTEVVESSQLNLDNLTIMIDDAHLDEAEENANCSERADEIQTNSLFQSSSFIMVGEVNVDGEGHLSSEAVASPITSACIKAIRPHHSTLVLSYINNLNILPHTNAFLTLSDSAPSTEST
ncbi:hypothetical protein O181_026924 [Austropuccinia psidii MF-1]|uniref:Integrase catalytic domain-containing protein n=1 Tax=Austropuccinia psidii MF-1 TaxID=1389203 RepID=A0A9Q3H235_9BASI|nr:hypothetical protein [Austropuccinia psidii MF-1]